MLSAITLVASLSACSSTNNNFSWDLFPTKANINNKTKFSPSSYGVAGSPRLTTSRHVKKGGGRYTVGKPYKIKGKWYYPKEEPGYDKIGMSSWYGPNFHGRLTANGEIYDQNHLSAAHPTFPLPSYARVINQANGRSVIVRVNDRGPFAHGRIIDLSSRAADTVGTKKVGVAKVRVQYIGRAPLHGKDMAYLTSSYRENNQGTFARETQLAYHDVKSSANPLKSDVNKSTLQKITQKPAMITRAPQQDLLTIFAGPDVYVPKAEVIGSLSKTDDKNMAQFEVASIANRADSPRRARPKVKKKQLTAALLKTYHLQNVK